MKKMLIVAALAAVLPQLAAAQVEKQVEVTKAYVPKVESASKLAVQPDMTDTARMRPEIDYTITPLSLRTTLSPRPIRPATVTYWEFNRPLPFYLKAGAGYPLNSVLDFYASSQNPSTGYVVGYVNHEGRYADIKNDFGVKNNSTRMFNRIGAAAGKYFGRHILEGDIYYDNRMYHRYGAWADGDGAGLGIGGMNDYGDANVAVRFGDNFQDLSRTNFEIALRGGMFFDHSEWPDYGDKARQTALGARAKIARGFGRSRFSLEAGYELRSGQKSLEGSSQQLIHAALRYGFAGGVVRFDVGADYYRDRTEFEGEPSNLVKSENYVIPFARLDFNLGTPGLKPFFEADGAVTPNDFRGADAGKSLCRLLDVARQKFRGLQFPSRTGRQSLAQPLRLPCLRRGVGPRQPSFLDHVPEFVGRSCFFGGFSGRSGPCDGAADRHFVQRRDRVSARECAEIRPGRARLSL